MVAPVSKQYIGPGRRCGEPSPCATKRCGARATPGKRPWTTYKVLVRCVSMNTWFVGTASDTVDNQVQVDFVHNGRTYSVVLARNSPHLRQCSQDVLPILTDIGPTVTKRGGSGKRSRLTYKVLVRCVAANTWFVGTACDVVSNQVHVEFVHNGRTYSVVLGRNSPYLRQCSQDVLPMLTDVGLHMMERGVTLPGASTSGAKAAEINDTIGPGDSVTFWSDKIGKETEGVVTDKKDGMVKVHYSAFGRPRCQVLPADTVQLVAPVTPVTS